MGLLLLSSIIVWEKRNKMELVENIETISKPYQNAVVTIGNFDGVHRGHQALLNEVQRVASEIEGTSVAVTFEPHPIRVLKKDGHPQHITLYEQKIELLERTGIDVTVCVKFTNEFAKITASQFIESILIDRIGMKAIVVGRDYAFGKNREGNVEFLRASGKKLGFDVIVKDWQTIADPTGKRISSTAIRKIVMAGDVEQAKDLLGRHYQIRGSVVAGRNRGGKLLGFPTANINLQDELCPKTGVYAVTVSCDRGTFPGVANIGYSPTFDDHLFTVEVHILDFNSDIYGNKIKVNFVRRLRDEMKFGDIEQLSNQIKKDIENARRILS